MRGINIELTKYDLSDGLGVKCTAHHCKLLTTTKWYV